jgi:hypothetical protein
MDPDFGSASVFISFVIVFKSWDLNEWPQNRKIWQIS